MALLYASLLCVYNPSACGKQMLETIAVHHIQAVVCIRKITPPQLRSSKDKFAQTMGGEEPFGADLIETPKYYPMCGFSNLE